MVDFRNLPPIPPSLLQLSSQRDPNLSRLPGSPRETGLVASIASVAGQVFRCLCPCPWTQTDGRSSWKVYLQGCLPGTMATASMVMFLYLCCRKRSEPPSCPPAAPPLPPPTALMRQTARRHWDLEAFDRVLAAATPEVIQQVDPRNGNTALHYLHGLPAVNCNTKDLLYMYDRLTSRGADPIQKNYLDDMPLQVLAEMDLIKSETIKKGLEQFLHRENVRDCRWVLSLKETDPSLYRLVCQQGLAVDEWDKAGRTALFEAVRDLSVPRVKVLLKLGANPEAPVKGGVEHPMALLQGQMVQMRTAQENLGKPVFAEALKQAERIERMMEKSLKRVKGEAIEPDCFPKPR